MTWGWIGGEYRKLVKSRIIATVDNQRDAAKECEARPERDGIVTLWASDGYGKIHVAEYHAALQTVDLIPTRTPR